MRFELKLNQKVLHNEEENVLVTCKSLEIEREEFIAAYEKDENEFFNTLRETIYMYHFANGFITQVSDFTMESMYQTFKENPSYKKISYNVEESEHLSNDNEYSREKDVSINLEYIS